MPDDLATQLQKATQRMTDNRTAQRDRAAELSKSVGAQRVEEGTPSESANPQQ